MRTTMRADLTAAVRDKAAITALRSAFAAIVANEVTERTTAADEYARLGRDDQSERLRAEADVLNRYLAGES